MLLRGQEALVGDLNNLKMRLFFSLFMRWLAVNFASAMVLLGIYAVDFSRDLGFFLMVWTVTAAIYGASLAVSLGKKIR